jgi:hypothetical protein
VEPYPRANYSRDADRYPAITWAIACAFAPDDTGPPAFVLDWILNNVQSLIYRTEWWQGTLVTTAAEVIEHLSPIGAILEPTNEPAVSDPACAASASAALASSALASPVDPPQPRSSRRRRFRPALDLDAMDLETTQVLDAMPARGGMATTRIAQRAGMVPTTAVRCLAALAASGFIERCDEGWRLSRG